MSNKNYLRINSKLQIIYLDTPGEKKEGGLDDDDVWGDVDDVS